MKPIVEVEHLAKLYRLGSVGATSLRDSLDWIFRRARPDAEPVKDAIPDDRAGPEPGTFWALKDVSFSVEAGKVFGIVGRNGAGKSTLLKLLSRITEPTRGRAILRGRVVSLLEVGTGFHPELTGRENIFLNGAILGMKRAEIARKLDAIIDFAEIGSFIDTPVKRYSSGMFVRLAFAVAAHLEPEILLIDEVLAVGDAGFQKKCLGKMGEVASQHGRTVFFVSHNMGAVRSLCEEAILIEGGCVAVSGKPGEVISRYLAATAPGEEASAGERIWPGENAPGNEELRLRRVRISDSVGAAQTLFEADEPIRVEVEYEVLRRVRGLRFHLMLQTQEGELAFAATDHLYQPESQVPGHYRTECVIPGRLLNRRNYTIAIGCGIPGERWLIPDTEFLSFSVSGAGNQASHFPEDWPGTVCPAIEWKVERCEPAPLVLPT